VLAIGLPANERAAVTRLLKRGTSTG
jgi:hypothetical protein